MGSGSPTASAKRRICPFSTSSTSGGERRPTRSRVRFAMAAEHRQFFRGRTGAGGQPMRSLVGNAVRSMVALVGFAMLPLGCSTETKVSAIEPNTGTFSGGEEVVIEGQNFPKGGATVKFALKDAQPVVVESDHKIRIQTPAGDKNTN